jgi:Alw26I/Eco31I/Esp3I family type II restriction m6 adenine DNA methyltransferase
VFHLELLKNRGSQVEALAKRASGRYYTGEVVGRRLAAEAVAALHQAFPTATSLSIADPFGGDGRLVEWLLEAWSSAGLAPVQWKICIWDMDDVGFDTARARFKRLSTTCKPKCKVHFEVVDSFAEAGKREGTFDLIITNPPWELLKPDRRELEALTLGRRLKYVSRLREYDAWLAANFPLSQPKRKFAGWGTNLSRAGFEASLKITRSGGVVAAVLPASFLADEQTSSLRRHLLTEHRLLGATYYPAEAKLYESADVASIGITLCVGARPATTLPISTHQVEAGVLEQSLIELDSVALQRNDYVIPISFGSKSLAILNGIASRFPAWIDLESSASDGLWAGREMDETGLSRWLHDLPAEGPRFVKGRMIGRYSTVEEPSQVVVRPGWTPPASVTARRIAWRDVSRPSQKRRVIATLIDADVIAGNSLGVAYFRNHAQVPLLALLGIMNSTCFEFQLRAHLATGHVSLSSLRKVAVPPASMLREATDLAALVRVALARAEMLAANVDAFVAKNIYGLTELEYETILQGFTGLTAAECRTCLAAYRTTPPLRSARLPKAVPKAAQPTQMKLAA